MLRSESLATQDVVLRIEAGQGLVRDKCPRGLVEIFELGATQFGAVEELSWLVNVDSVDL